MQEQKVQMTLKAYDNLCDRLCENEYQCGEWWPTIEDIQTYIEPEPEKYLEFMVWITETATTPQTEEEKESKNMLNRILTSIINFKDDENYDEKR